MPFGKEAGECFRACDRAGKAGGLEPVSQRLQERMQAQADVIAFLESPEGAEARRVSGLRNDEQEAGFAGILDAGACGEEDAEHERDPSADPALLEDRTMEACRAMEEKDAAARERQRAEKARGEGVTRDGARGAPRRPDLGARPSPAPPIPVQDFRRALSAHPAQFPRIPA